jgi:O-antigen/teichoic acid export membrane protein
MAMLSFINLADLGAQSFIGNLLASDYIQERDQDFGEKISESVSLFITISLALFILFVIILIIPYNINLIGKLSLDDKFIFLFMGSLYLIGIPGGIYATIYRATGLYHRSAMLGNMYKIVLLICCTFMLFEKLTPKYFALICLILGIINVIFIIWDSRCRITICRRIRLSLRAAWAGRVHLGGSFSFWVIALAFTLNFQGTIIVLGATAGSAAVALYATHRTLSGLIGYISILLQGPLWPEMTFLQAQEQKERLRRLSLLTIRIVILFSGVAALFGWLCFPAVYPLWTGRHLDIQPALLILLLVQGVLAAGWNTTGWPLLATNHHRPLALASLGNALLTVVLAAGLAPRYGVLGVAAASLGGDLVFGAAVFPGLLSRYLNLPLRTIFRAMAFPLLSLAIPGLILIWSAPHMVTWQLVLLAGLLALLFAYPAARLAIGKGELEWLLIRFQGFARRKSDWA